MAVMSWSLCPNGYRPLSSANGMLDLPWHLGPLECELVGLSCRGCCTNEVTQLTQDGRAEQMMSNAADFSLSHSAEDVSRSGVGVYEVMTLLNTGGHDDRGE